MKKLYLLACIHAEVQEKYEVEVPDDFKEGNDEIWAHIQENNVQPYDGLISESVSPQQMICKDYAFYGEEGDIEDQEKLK